MSDLNEQAGVDFLREIGSALYGDKWQYPLADLLGVSARTMRRWDANPYLVPDSVLDELHGYASARGAVLLRAHRKLMVEVTARATAKFRADARRAAAAPLLLPAASKPE